jgi:hypothetical protein
MCSVASQKSNRIKFAILGKKTKNVEFCLKDFCSLCYFGRIGSCSRDTYKSLGNWDSYYFIWGERELLSIGIRKKCEG